MSGFYDDENARPNAPEWVKARIEKLVIKPLERIFNDPELNNGDCAASLIGVLALLTAMPVFGVDLTDEQMEIWKNLREHFALNNDPNFRIEYGGDNCPKAMLAAFKKELNERS